MTGAPAVPRATIRLQFSKDFTFDQAAELAPYFADLGVSHVYASPFLKARSGSTHGYDITDHAQFNPEIGDQASFDRFVAALHQHDIGLILDFVPNHMGVGASDNPWWLDVLEWGPASPFAPFFDIDWTPLEPALHGKVLLPFLGDHYGAVLERGELQLKFDAERGSFSVWYWSHRFPVAVRNYPRLLKAARDLLVDEGVALDALIAAFAGLGSAPKSVQRQATVHREAEELRAQLAATVAAHAGIGSAIQQAVLRINGTPGIPDSFHDLHRLLEEQHYRVAFWRVAADEINYRRFFDINDLAGLRIDRTELFELAHQLVFRLIGEGKLQGIRLDHIDGLYDPVEYCERLQDRAAYLTLNVGASALDPPGVRLKQPFYVVVEKILAHHENLREGWPVAGTTGYEFMVLVGGLFVDPAAEEAMTRTYHAFIRREVDFDKLVIETKRKVMMSSLSSELHVLASQIHRLAQESWNTRDFTLTGIRRALVDVAACLPVYRTYVTAERVDEEDRKYLDWAVARARKLAGAADASVYQFLHGVLTTDLAREQEGSGRGRHGYKPADVVAIAMKFQQFTGPVMAKSLEDTVFYRYFRLVALNEVGGEPSRFGSSVSAFHHVNQERLKRFPFNLLATATHDHKRGEDTRARICVLSEMPDVWEQRVRRWQRMNRFKKREIEGLAAPGRNDEYMLYQMLVGAWPLDLDWPSGEGLKEFSERITAYMIKAVREAKVRSSWAAPNADYEDALQRFVQGVLDPERSATFLAELMDLLETVAPVGALNGLSQTLLKLTAPGVPDVYQGTDFWDLSLVDPDNRRPVDYAARRRALESLDGTPDLERLVEDWRDGRVKQFVVARTLGLRKREAALFATGDYRPVEAVGDHADRVVAFLRRAGDGLALVVAPRLTLPLMQGRQTPLPPAEAWGDTALMLPELPEGAVPVDVFTGRAPALPSDGRLPLAELLDRFPLALLHAPSGGSTG